MSRIIIGVDDRERSEDAIAFGIALAREGGAAVTVAHVYPWGDLAHTGTREYGEALLTDSEELLQRISDRLRDVPDLQTRSLADSSPARALQRLAEEQEAGLLVVGSCHTGRIGRVLPGSTAERLLSGSQCAVAVAPTGYAGGKSHPPGVIACGWDGRAESEAALGAAEELAERLSASLRVIRVFEPLYHPNPLAIGVAYEAFKEGARRSAEPVSYTHLTLPTICSV